MERFLGDRLNQAQNAGMNKEVVTDLAYQIGDYLAKQVEPKNEQEKFWRTFGQLQALMNSMRLPV